MKVILRINEPENISKTIYIDDCSFYVEVDDEKYNIDSRYEERFNTLIGLFGCKSSWIDNDLDDPIYSVCFIDNEEEIYTFSEAPSNWNMFMGYISRLAGESL